MSAGKPRLLSGEIHTLLRLDLIAFGFHMNNPQQRALGVQRFDAGANTPFIDEDRLSLLQIAVHFRWQAGTWAGTTWSVSGSMRAGSPAAGGE